MRRIPLTAVKLHKRHTGGIVKHRRPFLQARNDILGVAAIIRYVKDGTSLPELVTSVTAAKKGSADIAIGNIVGSNIFNILFVIGTTALIIPVPFAANFLIDSAIAIFAAILLWICVLKTKKLTRMGGIIMLLCYGAYFVYLLMQS